MPALYVKGGFFGVRLNLGSPIIAGYKNNSKTGVETISLTDHVLTQGIGIAGPGASLDYNRIVAPGGTEHVVSGTVLFGLLG